MPGPGGMPGPQMVNVPVPEGMMPGMAFTAQAPDGQLMEVVVPEGAGPGSVVPVPAPPPSAQPRI